MYRINVIDIESVTAAHIHRGQVGENGPVIITLFKEDNPTAATAITEVLLSEGNITATNLEGPMAGKLLSNLTSAMRDEENILMFKHSRIQMEKFADKYWMKQAQPFKRCRIEKLIVNILTDEWRLFKAKGDR